jgi:hypothetical protein
LRKQCIGYSRFSTHHINNILAFRFTIAGRSQYTTRLWYGIGRPKYVGSVRYIAKSILKAKNRLGIGQSNTESELCSISITCNYNLHNRYPSQTMKLIASSMDRRRSNTADPPEMVSSLAFKLSILGIKRPDATARDSS